MLMYFVHVGVFKVWNARTKSLTAVNICIRLQNSHQEKKRREISNTYESQLQVLLFDSNICAVCLIEGVTLATENVEAMKFEASVDLFFALLEVFRPPSFLFVFWLCT